MTTKLRQYLVQNVGVLCVERSSKHNRHHILFAARGVDACDAQTKAATKFPGKYAYTTASTAQKLAISCKSKVHGKPFCVTGGRDPPSFRRRSKTWGNGRPSEHL